MAWAVRESTGDTSRRGFPRRPSAGAISSATKTLEGRCGGGLGEGHERLDEGGNIKRLQVQPGGDLRGGQRLEIAGTEPAVLPAGSGARFSDPLAGVPFKVTHS